MRPRICWQALVPASLLALLALAGPRLASSQAPGGGAAVLAAQPAAPGAAADWQAQALRGIAEQEYCVTWQEETALPDVKAAWQAPNRAHNLRTYFTDRGPRIIRRTETDPSWQWGLELAGYGYEDAFGAAPAVKETSAAGNRIEFRRGGLIEWYVNSPEGLEQGFTILAPPHASDPSAIDNPPSAICIDLAVRGDLIPNLSADGQAVEFLSPGGVRLILYSALAAHDEAGASLPAALQLLSPDPAAVSRDPSSFIVRLSVNAAGATFPLTIDPLATSPNWTAERNQAYAQFGASVATAGDVNGDGYADVIVGAYQYDNGQTNEGMAFVFQGSASGLSAAPAWSAESDQANAAFGSSVSTAGDVNGDGFADVIVGASAYTNGEASEGRAYVYHGSASGLGAAAAWTAESNQAGAYFGASVSTAGDVNGDAYADVIVGAPNYDNGQTDEGRAYVYHGSATGLQATPAWTAKSNQANAYFGSSVSTAGDVNGDGYADVIVGAPNYDNGQTNEGRAYVYHGSASGLAATAAWSAESNQALAYFGTSVSTAGDVNGDGYADVIVGAPYYNNGQTDEGLAFVFQGSASGLASTFAWSAESNQASAFFGTSVSTAGDINGDGYADVIIGAYRYDDGQTKEGGAFVFQGSASGLGAALAWSAESDQSNAEFGSSVATAGDVNGDGYGDVIVGAHYYDNGQTDEGRAYVYHGSASGLIAEAGWTAQSGQANARLGQSVATAGDVNGDGYADVIVGACWYDNGQTDEGRAYVYHGSASGLGATAAWTGEINQAGAVFGGYVATAGDVNGDGYDDVIVGAPYYDHGQTDEGGAFVYHGSASGLGASAAWTAESDQADSYYGTVSTAGDVNGDGYDDVIVGADSYDKGQTDEGRAFVYLGSASGLSATAAWTAESDQAGANFGRGVSTAGDVNRDGYADVIVGAFNYDNGQTDEGRAYVYHGSASGLSAAAARTLEINQTGAAFGYAVSTAGDVNGDGYADAIVGAPAYDNGQTVEGVAFVFQGSASGLGATAAWTAESDQAYAYFGWSVSTAGDVNGDGYADVIVGAPYYDYGQTDEGRAYVYHGSASGLVATAAWITESNQTSANFGTCVSTAGDVNGDGYADVIVGSPLYDYTLTDEGRVFMCYGNGGQGLSLKPRQLRADSSQPIADMGLSDRADALTLAMLGRTPFGRGKVKLECEVKPLGTPFNGANTTATANWVDTTVAGAELSKRVVLSAGPLPRVHHWRARLLYHPATTPYQQRSRWITIPWNGWQEGDFRLPAPHSAVEDWQQY